MTGRVGIKKLINKPHKSKIYLGKQEETRLDEAEKHGKWHLEG